MSIKSPIRILFYLNRTRPNKIGKCPINLRISMNGKSVTFSVQRSIYSEFWDPKVGKCNGIIKEVKEINLYLEALRKVVYNKYLDLIKQPVEITPEIIRDQVLGINTAGNKDLCEIWDEHTTQLKAMLEENKSSSNYQKFNTCLRYMREFLLLEYKTKDISFKLVNHQFIIKFEKFLKIQKKCTHNTTMKFLHNFKHIVSIAINNDWIKKNPFKDIKLTMQEIDRPFLNIEEMNKITSSKFTSPKLKIVKDLFVFSSFTGLAYTDLLNLKRSEIDTNPNGSFWIRIRREKTKVKSQIPLLEIPLKIIKKYCSLNEMQPDEKIFPMLSNQRVNEFLKEIQTRAQILKKLTFHVARHTFATTVTLMHGVSIESISRMLGHSNIKITQHYARIVDKKLEDEMLLLAQKLNGKFRFD